MLGGSTRERESGGIYMKVDDYGRERDHERGDYNFLGEEKEDG